MQEIIDKEIDEMLRMGVIEHSEAPYCRSGGEQSHYLHLLAVVLRDAETLTTV